MKICLFLLALFTINLSAQTDYQKFFTDECLRIHYYHYGNRNEEEVIQGELYRDSLWAGSRVNLIDTLNLGAYLIKVSDLASNSLIYSYGFSTLFDEWRTTDEAIDGNSKIIEEVVRIPFPRDKVLIEYFKRDKQNHFTRIIGRNGKI
ncbi:MAG: peptidase M64 N-terminal domain-containing protein [Calditrichota bacterium]